MLQRDERIFIQIAYNYGYLLEQIDGKTGKRLWPAPLFVGPRPLDLRLGAIDDVALYCTAPNGEVEARRLADGSSLWKQAAGSRTSPSALQRSGSILLSYPATHEIQGWEFAWAGVAIRLPSFAARAAQNCFCTVAVLDPKTGQCLQSLNLAKPASAAPTLAVTRTAFSLSPQARPLDRVAPAVRLTTDRLLVMQGQAVTAFDITKVAAPNSSSASF